MTSLAPNALMVGLVQTLSGLPVFLLIIPAGALADLVDRRRLLLFAQGWMFIAAALLGWLTVEGAMTPWVLLLLTFVLGVDAALNAPAWQASLPELVSRDELTAAIASDPAKRGYHLGCEELEMRLCPLRRQSRR